jgi:cyclic beta-1,2-glucan synthetase
VSFRVAPHLRHLRRDLESAYAQIAQAHASDRPITPAAQWLLDNFHVVNESLNALPGLLSRELLAVLPAVRVVDAEGNGRTGIRIRLVLEGFVASVDNRILAEPLQAFLHSYQATTPLTMAELWAIPAFLRLAILENLRRIAEGTARALEARLMADRHADEVLAGLDSEPRPESPRRPPSMALPHPTVRHPFIVQLIERLRYRGEELVHVLESIAEILAADSLTLEECIRREQQRQGTNNVAAANAITSLRGFDAIEWRELFEALSVAEAALAPLPSYAAVDQTTRDRYRHAIAEIARRSGVSERSVAERARNAVSAIADPEAREADIGWHLVADGRPELERAVGYRLSLAQRSRRLLRRYPLAVYAGSVGLGTAAVLTGVAAYGLSTPLHRSSLVLLAFGVFPACDFAVRMVNLIITRLVTARPLPRLALARGIPRAAKTLLAMPVMLTSAKETAAHVERLEVHYLANTDDAIRFALLSDWSDSAQKESDRDRELLAIARGLIAKLNGRYPLPGGERRFFVFHRERLWNEREGCWMGWERKRGKLMELNRLLLGAPADETTFLRGPRGEVDLPHEIEFVLTVDADTRLPIGAIRKLIGTALHPLNQPRWNEDAGVVVAGYGVLQPRVTPLLPEREGASLFQWAVSGASGMDPYAGAVSDVYQDLFGTGIYTGKGLYHLRTFSRAVGDRLPENAVLSHDLLEGQFARCALVSDVEVYEEFPSHSEVAAARTHRWTRGDWQLLPWLVGARAREVSALGHWQLLDNLRRSLDAPLAIATIIAAWCVPSAVSVAWIGLALAPLFLPGLLSIITEPAPRPLASLADRLRGEIAAIRAELGRGLVAVTLLPQNAWLSLDAIARAVVRQFTRRRLLEWITAAHMKARISQALPMFAWPLKSASVIVIVATGLVLWLNPTALPEAAPWLLVFWLAPLIAQLLSAPRSRAGRARPAEVLYLRRLARRTWQFFAVFVTARENHLPPDNLQEDPAEVIAHRTSPTNIGLYLLAVATARDFGWLGLQDMRGRLSATFETLSRLERFRGHFLNWYDTRTLGPLEPRYVSVVDSGNLAGHLLALRQTCLALLQGPVVEPARSRGLLDALALFAQALASGAEERRTTVANSDELRDRAARLAARLARLPDDAIEARRLLRGLREDVVELADLSHALAAERREPTAEYVVWAQAFRADFESQIRDFDLLPADEALGREGSAKLWQELVAEGVLGSLAGYPARCLEAAARLETDGAADRQAFASALRSAAAAAGDIASDLMRLCDEAYRTALSMEFGFLYDRRRGLFSVGYRVAEGALDSSYYDLLASEARLASLLAIATGEAPVRHWFRLGRPLAGRPPDPVLLSWSGSMFEFMMPALVMQAPAGSLLETSCARAVRLQIEYARSLGKPWGVSESAFNARDQAFTYQYADFGVPSLGLKRGLGRNLVVAPYATALAAMKAPGEAVRNLEELRKLGALGIYGYYDAVDFTAERVPEGAACAVVRTFMTHHQGMSLVAIGNAVNGEVMQSRFHREPLVQAAALLLQERPPMTFRRSSRAAERPAPTSAMSIGVSGGRRVSDPFTSLPVAQMLSNGRYAVMITSAGSGYSASGARMITRWREDLARERYGTFIYLRDCETGKVWSAGSEPTGAAPDSYEASLDEDRVRIRRQDGTLATTLDVIVTPEHDAELRKLTVRNLGWNRRVIDVTSYAEIALAQQAADVAHPAFSNLFVQTEFDASLDALFASRRPRSSTDPPAWAGHVIASGPGSGAIEYETDRLRFIGRNGDVRAPLAVMDGRPLSNTIGAVLDPVFSLRTRMTIAPGEKASVTFATLVAGSRDQAAVIADKLNNPDAFERASMLTWTYVRAGLHFVGVSESEARQFQALATHLLFANPQLRASDQVLRRNRRSTSGLWRFGVSGDLPIVLVRCQEDEDGDFAAQLIRAKTYWEAKNLSVDVVFLNDRPHSYLQALQHRLEDLVRLSRALSRPDPARERGQAFVLRADQLTPEELTLLCAVARAILHPREGTLAEQLTRKTQVRAVAPPLAARYSGDAPPAAGTPEDLDFHNGIGGMTRDGREYVITLGDTRRTPAPWSNVIANPTLGCLVTESGIGCTWAWNSRENQLTPWSNDAASDPPGEALYIRDERSGALWTPTAQPIRVPGAQYVARHGQGYSRFGTTINGISSELTVFVAAEDPVKISRLRLTNASGRARQLSVTSYAEWALGPNRSAGAAHVVTERDGSGAVLARNPWNADFGAAVAFMDLGGQQTSVTGSRIEFLGRHGSMDAPAGLLRQSALSNRLGAGLDPCCALLTTIELAPGATATVVSLLGQAEDGAAAVRLVERYRRADPDRVLADVVARWDSMLGAVQIRTPDRALDHMMNRWLLYQVMSCRFWGRSAFYQAGGAWGFRDQLQDSLALVAVAPGLVREHLLRSAARQFEAGDVQHWWHPRSGRGVRTRCVDDRLWLPYVLLHYLAVTGDAKVLDAEVPFLEGGALQPQEDDAMFEPATSTRQASVYEHCALAIDASLATGRHGLPLMGGGDWNDGMNRVGRLGEGESTWMAWFLCSILPGFAGLAAGRGDASRAASWREHAQNLAKAADDAWDGAWYRRGYFDDGTPLGSATRAECRIDSLAQTWAVLSGAAPRERAAQALASVGEYLVRQADDLVLLLTPPFDKSAPDPGYIRGYLPGLRENGGHYSHAAVWYLIASARLGRLEDVGDLLRMLNPLHRSATRRQAHVYRVEPYVVAADISAEPPNAQRGGWTWYTGAASWLHHAVLEQILGIRIRSGKLEIQPALPAGWKSAEVRYDVGGRRCEIRLEREGAGSEIRRITVDGTEVSGNIVDLDARGTPHSVRVVLG